MFDQPLLLDMIFLGTPQLCGGVYILFFFKVSFEKHPTAHVPEIVFHQLFNFLSLSPGQPSGCAQEGAILSKDLELGAQVTGHQLKLT